jgi:chromosome segregation ATPase
VLHELDRARVELVEALTQLSCRERDLKAADSRKREIERELERLEEEMRTISEMVIDKKDRLRDREREIQAATAESVKCEDELKEVESSLSSVYKAYEADRLREEETKRRLELLEREELCLMENQHRIKISVDTMRSDMCDFHQEMKELDLFLESKKKSVEEMKMEETACLMNIENEKRKLNSIRENAAEESLFLTELRDKVALSNMDLNSVKTDLRDVTTELKFKLDEIEENQKKFENDQIENRKKLEKSLLELERVEGMVINEKNMLSSLSAEHENHMKNVWSLKEMKASLERSVSELSEAVSELREGRTIREAEKDSLEKEIRTLHINRAVEEEKLHSLIAIIGQRNSILAATESDTVTAAKKLNKMKSLCMAEERIICHQRLQLKCCLDEMLAYETKLKEKAVRVRVESSLEGPALRSEREPGSENRLGSGRDLKCRE